MKSPEQEAEEIARKWAIFSDEVCLGEIEVSASALCRLQSVIAAALQSKQAELDDTKHNLAISDAAYDLAKAELDEAIGALRPFARLANEAVRFFHPHSPELRDSMPIKTALGPCRQAAAIVAQHDARRGSACPKGAVDKTKLVG